MEGVEIGNTKVLFVLGENGIRGFEDRCGHMSTPLSLGTLKSGVIKGPLHSAVFDAETGSVRGLPVIHMGGSGLPPEMLDAMKKMGELMGQIRTEVLRPFPVAVESGPAMVYV